MGREKTDNNSIEFRRHNSEGETPGPIPNPEAKPFSADGTALVTGWESRSPPDILRLKSSNVAKDKRPSESSEGLLSFQAREEYRVTPPPPPRDRRTTGGQRPRPASRDGGSPGGRGQRGQPQGSQGSQGSQVSQRGQGQRPGGQGTRDRHPAPADD